MTFLDAAAEILKRAEEPLHYRELTRRALAQGLVQTEGRTPEATLYALVSLDMKRKRAGSRFQRVSPGVVALRSWEPTGSLEEERPEEEGDRRVRVPRFPLYSEAQAVIPIWDGQPRRKITGLRATLHDLLGSPKAPVDWSEPDEWIPARLTGDARELAEAIWRESNRRVNPRYVYGTWLLAQTYGLLTADESDEMRLTPRGSRFVANDSGGACRHRRRGGIIAPPRDSGGTRAGPPGQLSAGLGRIPKAPLSVPKR